MIHESSINALILTFHSNCFLCIIPLEALVWKNPLILTLKSKSTIQVPLRDSVYFRQYNKNNHSILEVLEHLVNLALSIRSCLTM